MIDYTTTEAIASEIEEMVKEHVSMDIPFSQDTHLQDDLDMDSLERVELGVKLEKKFGILLPDSQIRQCETIGDLTRLVVNARELAV